MALCKQEINDVITTHRLSATDVGSTPVQVALLTTNIKNLTQHLKNHNKDTHSQRGLIAMVNKRRKLLNYLKREDLQAYRNLIEKLGLRH
jgi:small subunit ribosomal protein S15